jgi:hypothetical protein
MRPHESKTGAGRRSGHAHLSFLLLAIITLSMGMGVTMLDASLAAQVPGAALLLVGCAALSAFIVLGKAERP